MRYSVIDIGTNTMLLLIAEYDSSNKTVRTVLDIQRVPRLGKGVDASRNITADSINKAIGVLNDYKVISAEYKSERIFATATSFIRDSANRDEFLKKIKDKTGISIEVLSGEEEANLTFSGAVYDKIKTSEPGHKFCTIDIGGGSTEISFGSPADAPGGEPCSFSVSGKSIDVGSVRLNEKFNYKHPPTYESIANSELFVKDLLSQVGISDKSAELIGVAGTVTTLAAVKLGLSAFDAEKVDGTILTLDEIETIFNRLAAMPIEEIYAIGNFMEGRADIIIPGILILKTFMEQFGFGRITVSAKGLRYGTLIDKASKQAK